MGNLEDTEWCTGTLMQFKHLSGNFMLKGLSMV